MTTPLQITRYDRLVRRAMGLVGEGAIVTGVLPDVFPVMELENERIELLALAQWTVGLEMVDFTSGVGLRSRAQCFNPATSQKLVVVEQITFSTAVASEIRWGMATAAIATFQDFFTARDSRLGDLTAEMRLEDGGAAAPAEGQIFLPIGGIFTLSPPGGVAVLFPRARQRRNSTRPLREP